MDREKNPAGRNYREHGQTLEVNGALQELIIELRIFQANETNLVQLAKAFIISKIKDTGTKRWKKIGFSW